MLYKCEQNSRTNTPRWLNRNIWKHFRVVSKKSKEFLVSGYQPVTFVQSARKKLRAHCLLTHVKIYSEERCKASSMKGLQHIVKTRKSEWGFDYAVAMLLHPSIFYKHKTEFSILSCPSRFELWRSLPPWHAFYHAKVNVSANLQLWVANGRHG